MRMTAVQMIFSRNETFRSGALISGMMRTNGRSALRNRLMPFAPKALFLQIIRIEDEQRKVLLFNYVLVQVFAFPFVTTARLGFALVEAAFGVDLVVVFDLVAFFDLAIFFGFAAFFGLVFGSTFALGVGFGAGLGG